MDSLSPARTAHRPQQLIDGHLHRDMEVDVEILDVTEEARALLLSIDPLAALAQTQEQLHDRLLELAPSVSPDLQTVWEATADLSLAASATGEREGITVVPDQFLILVKCRDEKHQIELTCSAVSRWRGWCAGRWFPDPARRLASLLVVNPYPER
jgi:hypothetical protein